jgi:hypothetical protein
LNTYQLDGLNDFLDQVYGSSQLLGTALVQCGLTEAEVVRLSTQYLEPFLETLLNRWCPWFLDNLPHIRGRVLIRRYGLDGRPAATLQELGDDHGLSRERVRQLEESALSMLRSRERRAILDSMAYQAAKGVLFPTSSKEPR